MKKDTEFGASEAFWTSAGVPQSPIVADLDWIRRKHPEEFKTDADVADHIRFVLAGDAFWTLPGTTTSARMFIRQDSRKCSVVQLLRLKAGYRVLTAYTVRPERIARAIESSGGPDANLESGGRGEDATHPGPQGLPCGQASRRKGKDSLTGKKVKTNGTLGSPQDRAGRAEGLRAQAKELRESAKRHKDLAKRLKAVPALQRDRLRILQEGMKADELLKDARGLETAAAELEAEARAEGYVASGQHVSGADTRPTRKAEAGTMKRNTKTNAAKATPSGRKAKPAAKPPAKAKAKRSEPAKVQPLKSAKAERYRLEKAVETLLDQTTEKPTKKPAKKAAAPKGTLESATLKIRFNPGSVKDVEHVWEAWTGAKPGQVLKLSVDDPTGTLPADVALLGRVSRLIQTDGTLKDFNDSGPLMVTDGKAKHVWMIHPKGFRFDLAPSVICYLAKKPKFGDRELIEYVHAFDRPARARMAGQVGTLTGGFSLTPRGIEG